MRRTVVSLFLALLLILSFAACGASRSTMSGADSQAVEGAKTEEKKSAVASENVAGSNKQGQPSNSASGGSVNTPPDSSVRKEIKTGEISIEVKDVDRAYGEITKLVTSLGGYEFSKSLSSQGKFKHLVLVLRIPPEKLQEFQDKLNGSGSITSESIRSEDITAQYYDASARLQNLKNGRDQLNEMLKKAVNMDESLKIWSEINRIQGDIDSLQGQINMWDKLVALSTITLYIDEEESPFRHSLNASWKFSSAEDIVKTMKNGFINTVNIIYNIIVWLLIIIVGISPLLAAAGIVAAVVLFVSRRKRKRK